LKINPAKTYLNAVTDSREGLGTQQFISTEEAEKCS